MLAALVVVCVAAAPAPALATGTTTFVSAASQEVKSGMTLLCDLGKKRSQVIGFQVSNQGVGSYLDVWASKRGKFDSSQAKAVAADFNGDGQTDLAVLSLAPTRPAG